MAEVAETAERARGVLRVQARPLGHLRDRHVPGEHRLERGVGLGDDAAARTELHDHQRHRADDGADGG